MDLTVIAAFATVALTLIVLPGPDWAFLLTAGTAQRVVLPAVAGLAIDYLMLSAVIAAGVAPSWMPCPPPSSPSPSWAVPTCCTSASRPCAAPAPWVPRTSRPRRMP